MLEEGFSFVTLILPGMDGRYLEKDTGVPYPLSDEVKGVTEDIFECAEKS